MSGMTNIDVLNVTYPISGNSSVTKIKADGHGTEKLAQACRDFESIFVNYMLQQMRRTVPQDGLFDGGKGEELFTSLLDGETAKSISNNQGLGLAAVMFRQLADQVAGEKKPF